MNRLHKHADPRAILTDSQNQAFAGIQKHKVSVLSDSNFQTKSFSPGTQWRHLGGKWTGTNERISGSTQITCSGPNVRPVPSMLTTPGPLYSSPSLHYREINSQFAKSEKRGMARSRPEKPFHRIRHTFTQRRPRTFSTATHQMESFSFLFSLTDLDFLFVRMRFSLAHYKRCVRQSANRWTNGIYATFVICWLLMKQIARKWIHHVFRS